MGVRAIRVRIECDRETVLALWRTHCVFNERVARFIAKLFALRRGEVGATPEHAALYQRIAAFVLARDSRDAPYLLNSISITGWKPATALKMKAAAHVNGADCEVKGEEWAHEAASLSAQGILAFDKEAERDGLPDSLFHPLIRDAVACISSHDQLVQKWKKEHAAWQQRKLDWEAREEHRKYLALRPQLDAFEQSVGGKAGKRRGRWHLYLDWLRNNPHLAAWRGGEAVVHPLSPEARERVAKAPAWKQRSIEAEEFWRANPELAALDRLHGFYEREFVRRRKTKKNVDGFDHRPTFTMPHAIRHPRWTLFNAPQTSPQGYADLQLPDRSGVGSVRLRLLTGERSEYAWPQGWVLVRFRSDPRLAQFVSRKETRTIRKGKRKGEQSVAETYRFIDMQLGGIERPAQISGVRLLFKDIRLNDDGSLKSATPYLVFSCTLENLPLTERARAIQWTETGEVTKTGKKRKSKKLPVGLVTCAVDLGVRNLGFLTLASLGDEAADGICILRSRNQWLGEEEANGNHAGRWSAGPDLAHIGRHKREIRRLRRLRGKPVKGEKSHVRLQDHITCMSQDRFKKAARAIVDFALNIERRINPRTGEPYPRADVLLLEGLAGFIPDGERERGINRAIVAWNRGQLVTRLKEVAADAGLKLFEVHPAGTSQCCCKCGGLGRRYSIIRDGETGAPVIRMGWGGKLFACPNPRCAGRRPERASQPFTCNADYNASVNLHRRFVMGDKAVAAFFAWRNKSERERDLELREIDKALLPQLERLHGLGPPEPETPF